MARWSVQCSVDWGSESSEIWRPFGFFLVTLFSKTSQHLRPKLVLGENFRIGSIFHLALAFWAYLNFWLRYGHLSLIFRPISWGHFRTFFSFLHFLPKFQNPQPKNIHNSLFYSFHKCGEDTQLSSKPSNTGLLGVLFPISCQNPIQKFGMDVKQLQFWQKMQNWKICLKITICMNVSRFMNLAAIFSLDLESQFTILCNFVPWSFY